MKARRDWAQHRGPCEQGGWRGEGSEIESSGLGEETMRETLMTTRRRVTSVTMVTTWGSEQKNDDR